MNHRSLLVPALIAAAGASPAALAQAEYAFFLVDAFNTTYPLRECYVTEINAQNVASGAGTAASSYSGFLWTEATEKQAIPVSSPKGLSNPGVVVDNNFVFATATGVSTTVPGVGPYTVPRLYDVNDAGMVAGLGWAGGNCSMVTCYAPLLWDGAQSRLLAGVPHARDLVRINNTGQVLGHIARVVFDYQEAFVYDLGTSTHTNLSDGLPPHWLTDHALTEAVDLSDSGMVTGTAQFGMEPQQAFLWAPGAGHTFLPGLKQGEVSRVTPGGVNSVGVVVGMAAIAPAGAPEFALHAFIWDAQNGMRDLNDLADLPAGFILDRAYKINDNGWIVGHGHFGPGWATARGFVLKPVDQGCAPDCNVDGALNLADFGCFQTKFALGDPYADCNGDGLLNLADFGCFQTKFALGCP